MNNESHQARLRKIMEENLAILEDKLALFVDPAKALQIVFEVEQLKLKLQQAEVGGGNDPQLILDALTAAESWYLNRNYPYPDPERLKEQRTYWKEKLTHTTRT